MEKDSYKPGEPCWMDCGTDLTKAPAFYASLFGWTIEDLGEAGGGYQMASLGGRQIAGFGPQQNPGQPFWNVYFRVDDATKATELVRSNGGSVLVDVIEVPEAGTMAVLADPVGAAFSIWQPSAHEGFGTVDAPGTFCWAELITTDVATSKRFYGDVFGFTTKDSDDPTMNYLELQLDGTSIGGMMPKPDGAPAEMPPFWGVYVAVADADATVATVAKLGGSTVMGPMDVPAGRIATCVDNVGAIFHVIQLPEA